MSNNPFKIKPIKIKPINIYGSTQGTKKSCPKTIRDQLRVKWWKGEYEGNCFCCGRKISYEHVEAGRIKAGGQYSVPNTRLICKTCNRGMGKTNLKVYMKRNYPERHSRFFHKDEIKGQTKPTKKPKDKTSSEPTWINPNTGKKEKFNLF